MEWLHLPSHVVSCSLNITVDNRLGFRHADSAPSSCVKISPCRMKVPIDSRLGGQLVGQPGSTMEGGHLLPLPKLAWTSKTSGWLHHVGLYSEQPQVSEMDTCCRRPTLRPAQGVHKPPLQAAGLVYIVAFTGKHAHKELSLAPAVFVHSLHGLS